MNNIIASIKNRTLRIEQLFTDTYEFHQHAFLDQSLTMPYNFKGLFLELKKINTNILQVVHCLPQDSFRSFALTQGWLLHTFSIPLKLLHS